MFSHCRSTKKALAGMHVCVLSQNWRSRLRTWFCCCCSLLMASSIIAATVSKTDTTMSFVNFRQTACGILLSLLFELCLWKSPQKLHVNVGRSVSWLFWRVAITGGKKKINQCALQFALVLLECFLLQQFKCRCRKTLVSSFFPPSAVSRTPQRKLSYLI